MIGLLINYVDQTERVAKAARKAAYRLVDKAAFAIRTTASESVKAADGPSAPGTPPHTHTQRITKKGKVRKGVLPKAIVYASKRGEAVIGPRKSVVGLSAAAHEFGGEFKGEQYPERPFMGPALEENLTSFGNSFAGSIGG